MSTKKIQIIDSIIKQAENADTLDGKHAEDFALASDVITLQAQVGDSSVSEQISAALEEFSSTTTPGGSITVDSEFSNTSENPVQNKVVTQEFMEVKDRLSTIPVFETREELFDQTITTEPGQSAVALEDFNLNLQDGEVYYITINGTTYQGTAAVTNDAAALSNGLSSDDKDFVGIQIAFDGPTGVIYFSASGTYDLIVSKPTYHELDDKYLPDYPVVFVQAFNTLEEMQLYQFVEGRLYAFMTAGSLTALVDSGRCLGVYSAEVDRILQFINYTTGICWKLNFDTGEFTQTSIFYELWEKIGEKFSSAWDGKKAVFYGDSLTEVNYHYTKGYHEWVKEFLGLSSYINYGKSGYTLANIYDKVCSTATLADIVFVMGGVNDQTYSVPLGTISDTTTDTTYGSLNLLCSKLKEKYPTSAIVFITPHYQTKYPHKSGTTSYEISNAIKKVCERFAISVYDNFKLGEIFGYNFAQYTTDNCHWNDKAHEMVGKNLAKFVDDNFRYAYGNTPEWIGKTVTVELNSNSTDQMCHLTALVEVDSDITNGAVVTTELEGVNCVNMISATKSGGHIFSDSTGAVSNGSYVKSLTAGGTVSHVQTVENGTMVHTCTNRTIVADVTTSYIKVPFMVFGTTPYSFDISKISIKVNGIKKPILALGSFFASDKEIVNISSKAPEIFNIEDTKCFKDEVRTDGAKITLTLDQVDALDNLFEIAAYKDEAVREVYKNFVTAFGLDQYRVVREFSANECVPAALTYFYDPSTGTASMVMSEYGPYTRKTDKRFGYIHFDIPCEYGYTYKLDFDAIDTSVLISVEIFNEYAVEKVKLNEDFRKEDQYDPGWLADGVFTPPETLNGYPVAGFRFVFNTIDPGITKVILLRKKVV